MRKRKLDPSLYEGAVKNATTPADRYYNHIISSSHYMTKDNRIVPCKTCAGFEKEMGFHKNK